MSVVTVERMSRREVLGWLAWFQLAKTTATPPPDDAIDMRTLSQAELRSMFNHPAPR